MSYIPYTFCQYMYRHIYIYLYTVTVKGFIPKHTINLMQKYLNTILKNRFIFKKGTRKKNNNVLNYWTNCKPILISCQH